MEKIDLEDHLTCPICLETPRYEIVQCRNGQHICGGCRKPIANCPQCRIPYDKEDIRNLAIESLLDSMEFQCPFKEDGCLVKLPRKDLDGHEAICMFRPATKQFCSRHLGWKDCKATVDDSSLLSHLEEQHQVKKLSNNTFQIGLEYGERPSRGNGMVYFDPIVVTSLPTPILPRTVMTASGHIVLTCFMFTNTEGMADTDVHMDRFQVNYLIEFDKEAKLEWSGYMQSYRKFEKISNRNSFHIQMKPAEEEHGQGMTASAQAGDLRNNLKIKAAIFKGKDLIPPRWSGGGFQFPEVSISRQGGGSGQQEQRPGIVSQQPNIGKQGKWRQRGTFGSSSRRGE